MLLSQRLDAVHFQISTGQSRTGPASTGRHYFFCLNKWSFSSHVAVVMRFKVNVALAQSTQQENDYRRLCCLKYHKNRLRLLTCVFEGVTTRIIGQTFNLTCSPDYHRWLETTCHQYYLLSTCARKIRLYLKIRIPVRMIQRDTIQAHNQHLRICPSVQIILLPWLKIQAADIFLNNNPKFKPTMSIPAILSEGKDPLGLPDPVPQQIVVLPNDRGAHMPIAFPVTFLHTPTRRTCAFGCVP
jgi:hypothetical protein